MGNPSQTHSQPYLSMITYLTVTHWQQRECLIHISVFVVCLSSLNRQYHTTHNLPWAVMAWFLMLETLTNIINALQGKSVTLMCLNWYRYSWSAVRPHMLNVLSSSRPTRSCKEAFWPLVKNLLSILLSFHIRHPLSLLIHFGLININLTICVAQAPRLCQKC